MGQSEKQLWEAQGVARGQRPEQGLQTLHTVGDEAQLGWGSGVTLRLEQSVERSRKTQDLSS